MVFVKDDVEGLVDIARSLVDGCGVERCNRSGVRLITRFHGTKPVLVCHMTTRWPPSQKAFCFDVERLRGHRFKKLCFDVRAPLVG